MPICTPPTYRGRVLLTVHGSVCIVVLLHTHTNTHTHTHKHTHNGKQVDLAELCEPLRSTP